MQKRIQNSWGGRSGRARASPPRANLNPPFCDLRLFCVWWCLNYFFVQSGWKTDGLRWLASLKFGRNLGVRHSLVDRLRQPHPSTLGSIPSRAQHLCPDLKEEEIWKKNSSILQFLQFKQKIKICSWTQCHQQILTMLHRNNHQWLDVASQMTGLTNQSASIVVVLYWGLQSFNSSHSSITLLGPSLTFVFAFNCWPSFNCHVLLSSWVMPMDVQGSKSWGSIQICRERIST